MPLQILLPSIVLMLVAGCTSKMERDYITGCVASGAPKEKCSCAFEKLENQYPGEVFERMEKTGFVPDDFMQANVIAIKSCMAE